ncbi:MAG: anti-sigma factor family protein [Saprospiraceae bacterium]
MKTQDEQMLWKYLDSEANEQERTAVEQRVSEEAAFQQEFQARQQLHTALQKMEAEQPSMRFVMNVMDRLPILYKKTIEPLVNPKWVKAFFGSLGIFIAGLFGYAATLGGSTTNYDVPGANFIQRFNALPSSVFTILAMVSFTYLFFVILDRQLKKRFARK